MEMPKITYWPQRTRTRPHSEDALLDLTQVNVPTLISYGWEYPLGEIKAVYHVNNEATSWHYTNQYKYQYRREYFTKYNSI